MQGARDDRDSGHLPAMRRDCEGFVMWKPIKTAPSFGTVMLWDGAMVFEGIFLEDYGNWYAIGAMPMDGYTDLPVSPTHWQPLPEPPK